MLITISSQQMYRIPTKRQRAQIQIKPKKPARKKMSRNFHFFFLQAQAPLEN